MNKNKKALIRRAAKSTGLSEKQVLASLDRLMELGYIQETPDDFQPYFPPGAPVALIPTHLVRKAIAARSPEALEKVQEEMREQAIITTLPEDGDPPKGT